jgi:Leucine rich repeat/Leucine Rich repeat
MGQKSSRSRYGIESNHQVRHDDIAIHPVDLLACELKLPNNIHTTQSHSHPPPRPGPIHRHRHRHRHRHSPYKQTDSDATNYIDIDWKSILQPYYWPPLCMDVKNDDSKVPLIAAQELSTSVQTPPLHHDDSSNSTCRHRLTVSPMVCHWRVCIGASDKSEISILEPEFKHIGTVECLARHVCESLTEMHSLTHMHADCVCVSDSTSCQVLCAHQSIVPGPATHPVAHIDHSVSTTTDAAASICLHGAHGCVLFVTQSMFAHTPSQLVSSDSSNDALSHSHSHSHSHSQSADTSKTASESCVIVKKPTLAFREAYTAIRIAQKSQQQYIVCPVFVDLDPRTVMQLLEQLHVTPASEAAMVYSQTGTLSTGLHSEPTSSVPFSSYHTESADSDTLYGTRSRHSRTPSSKDAALFAQLDAGDRALLAALVTHSMCFFGSALYDKPLHKRIANIPQLFYSAVQPMLAKLEPSMPLPSPCAAPHVRSTAYLLTAIARHQRTPGWQIHPSNILDLTGVRYVYVEMPQDGPGVDDMIASRMAHLHMGGDVHDQSIRDDPVQTIHLLSEHSPYSVSVFSDCEYPVSVHKGRFHIPVHDMVDLRSVAASVAASGTSAHSRFSDITPNMHAPSESTAWRLSVYVIVRHSTNELPHTQGDIIAVLPLELVIGYADMQTGEILHDTPTDTGDMQAAAGMPSRVSVSIGGGPYQPSFPVDSHAQALLYVLMAGISPRVKEYRALYDGIVALFRQMTVDSHATTSGRAVDDDESKSLGDRKSWVVSAQYGRLPWLSPQDLINSLMADVYNRAHEKETVDQFDSFGYPLAHYICALGCSAVFQRMLSRGQIHADFRPAGHRSATLQTSDTGDSLYAHGTEASQTKPVHTRPRTKSQSARQHQHALSGSADVRNCVEVAIDAAHHSGHTDIIWTALATTYELSSQYHTHATAWRGCTSPDATREPMRESVVSVHVLAMALACAHWSVLRVIDSIGDDHHYLKRKEWLNVAIASSSVNPLRAFRVIHHQEFVAQMEAQSLQHVDSYIHDAWMIGDDAAAQESHQIVAKNVMQYFLHHLDQAEMLGPRLQQLVCLTPCVDASDLTADAKSEKQALRIWEQLLPVVVSGNQSSCVSVDLSSNGFGDSENLLRLVVHHAMLSSCTGIKLNSNSLGLKGIGRLHSLLSKRLFGKNEAPLNSASVRSRISYLALKDNDIVDPQTVVNIVQLANLLESCVSLDLSDNAFGSARNASAVPNQGDLGRLEATSNVGGGADRKHVDVVQEPAACIVNEELVHALGALISPWWSMSNGQHSSHSLRRTYSKPKPAPSQISDSIVHALQSVKCVAFYVTDLNISNCELNASSVPILELLIAHNTTISSLTLDGNDLGDAGVTRILTALCGNRTMNKLSVRNTGMDRGAWHAFAHLLQVNRSLHHFDARDNGSFVPLSCARPVSKHISTSQLRSLQWDFDSLIGDDNTTVQLSIGRVCDRNQLLAQFASQQWERNTPISRTDPSYSTEIASTLSCLPLDNLVRGAPECSLAIKTTFWRMNRTSLSQLRWLSLSRCSLKQLAAGLMSLFASLQSLEYLDISLNELSSIIELAELSSLRSLDVSYNKVIVPPFFLCDMPHLTEVDLTGNKLGAALNSSDWTVIRAQLTQRTVRRCLDQTPPSESSTISTVDINEVIVPGSEYGDILPSATIDAATSPGAGAGAGVGIADVSTNLSTSIRGRRINIFALGRDPNITRLVGKEFDANRDYNGPRVSGIASFSPQARVIAIDSRANLPCVDSQQRPESKSLPSTHAPQLSKFHASTHSTQHNVSSPSPSSFPSSSVSVATAAAAAVGNVARPAKSDKELSASRAVTKHRTVRYSKHKRTSSAQVETGGRLVVASSSSSTSISSMSASPQRSSSHSSAGRAKMLPNSNLLVRHFGPRGRSELSPIKLYADTNSSLEFQVVDMPLSRCGQFEFLHQLCTVHGWTRSIPVIVVRSYSLKRKYAEMQVAEADLINWLTRLQQIVLQVRAYWQGSWDKSSSSARISKLSESAVRLRMGWPVVIAVTRNGDQQQNPFDDWWQQFMQHELPSLFPNLKLHSFVFENPFALRSILTQLALDWVESEVELTPDCLKRVEEFFAIRSRGCIDKAQISLRGELHATERLQNDIRSLLQVTHEHDVLVAVRILQHSGRLMYVNHMWLNNPAVFGDLIAPLHYVLSTTPTLGTGSAIQLQRLRQAIDRHQEHMEARSADKTLANSYGNPIGNIPPLAGDEHQLLSGLLQCAESAMLLVRVGHDSFTVGPGCATFHDTLLHCTTQSRESKQPESPGQGKATQQLQLWIPRVLVHTIKQCWDSHVLNAQHSTADAVGFVIQSARRSHACNLPLFFQQLTVSLGIAGISSKISTHTLLCDSCIIVGDYISCLRAGAIADPRTCVVVLCRPGDGDSSHIQQLLDILWHECMQWLSAPVHLTADACPNLWKLEQGVFAKSIANIDWSEPDETSSTLSSLPGMIVDSATYLEPTCAEDERFEMPPLLYL